MKKPINKRKNEIMSASLIHKKAFEFFEKTLKINHDADIESFLIKIPEYHNGQYIIKMLFSELQSNKFIELYTVTNKTYKPFSKTKELLLWKYHKHLEEYETTLSEEQVKYYLIPVSELSIVSMFIDECLDDENDDFDFGKSEVPMKEEHHQTPNLFSQRKVPEPISSSIKKPLQDVFLMHLTARDLFSIIHAKPVSNKDWINKLVTENK